jgi:diguanylate cyclase (GGDEF)-like protein
MTLIFANSIRVNACNSCLKFLDSVPKCVDSADYSERSTNANMQLKRLKIFLDLFATESRESDVGDLVTGFEVFIRSESIWKSSKGSKIDSEDLHRKLDLTLSRGTPWRYRNGTDAFFPILPLDAVIQAQFVAPTRKKTREKYQKCINKVIENASAHYDATHDNLTGLPNSRSLEKEIKIVLAEKPPLEQVVGEKEVKPSITIGIIAVDLDHFKQTNDSYGHDYGDIVLECFAHRLEEIINKIKLDATGNIQLYPGRSGGEEFNIILSGIISAESAKNIAEQIRHAISNQVIPSDGEWSGILKRKAQSGLILPHASERKITASIGLSSLKPPAVTDSLNNVSLLLRREADTALYRAKAGGRDAVRFFPEIKDKYGSVIEHHPETNVVTIDIGSQVGVSTGHEFHVYHPDFTGKKGFYFSDGRSKKRLGTYPRYAAGNSILFCC